MEALEDEAQGVPPEIGPLLGVERADVGAVDRVAPAAGGRERPQHREQRGLAGAGGAHHRHELAAADREIDAADRLHRGGAFAVALAQLACSEKIHLQFLRCHRVRNAMVGSSREAWMAGTRLARRPRATERVTAASGSTGSNSQAACAPPWNSGASRRAPPRPTA